MKLNSSTDPMKCSLARAMLHRNMIRARI
jgi:hypothetical protein